MTSNSSHFKKNNKRLFAEFISFFSKRTIISQLILINLIIYLLVAIVGIIFWLFQINMKGINSLIWWIAVSADMQKFMLKPWSILTYMFVHEELLHFLFNMLWLYWFGRIFQRFISSNKILGTYLIGGIAGGLLFMLAYNFFPVFNNILDQSLMIGASASITAIVFTVSFFSPNYEIVLFLIGRIKLKYISLLILFFDIIAIGQENTGGHIAHIGGAVFGILYGTRLKTGYDFLTGFHALFYSKYKFEKRKKPNLHNVSDIEYNRQKKDSQDRINEILDKISKSGYESLTKEEKKTLFNADN